MGDQALLEEDDDSDEWDDEWDEEEKGKSKGAALVVFSSDEEKQRAIENLNKVEFEGRELTVREWEAIKKEDMLDFSALEGDGDQALLEEDDDSDEWDDEWDEEENKGETEGGQPAAEAAATAAAAAAAGFFCTD